MSNPESEAPSNYARFVRGVTSDTRRQFIIALRDPGDPRRVFEGKDTGRVIHVFMEEPDDTISLYEISEDCGMFGIEKPFESDPVFFAAGGWHMFSDTPRQLSAGFLVGTFNGKWRQEDHTERLLQMSVPQIQALAEEAEAALAFGIPFGDDDIEEPEHRLSSIEDDIKAFFGKPPTDLSQHDVDISRRLLGLVRGKLPTPPQAVDLSPGGDVFVVRARDMSRYGDSFERVVCGYSKLADAEEHRDAAQDYIDRLSALYNGDIPSLEHPLDPEFSGGSTMYSVVPLKILPNFITDTQAKA